MAKIYETQKDFEQDKLKDQSKDQYLKAAGQMSTGLASALGASIVDSINTKNSTGMRVASSLLNIFGIIEVVRSLFTASKGHDLALKHERMGPQAVVLPLETVPNGNGESCNKCKHTQTIQPTTLLEQAARTDSTLERK